MINKVFEYLEKKNNARKFSYRREEYFYSFLLVKRVYVLYDYPYGVFFWLKRRRLIVKEVEEFKDYISDLEFENLIKLRDYNLG